MSDQSYLHAPASHLIRFCYIDDLEVELKRQQLDVKVVKFADDTKGGKVIVNTEDREKLQRALDILCDWADK